MQRIHYCFRLRNNYKAENGKIAISFYTNFDNRARYFSTSLYVLPRFWDGEHERARIGCPDFVVINNRLQAILQEFQDLVVKAQRSGRDLSFAQVAEIFAKKKSLSTDLVEFMELDLKNFSGKYSKETIHTYTAQLSKLKDFNSSIRFEDISPAWWYRYEQFMSERGNCAHTKHKCFTHLKSFINRAVEAGIIDKNPLKGVKVKTGQGNRVYLSKTELASLVDVYKKLHFQGLKNSIRIFLFACYTGLRYTDIKLLAWNNVKEDHIEIKFHKTSKHDIIPLNEKAIELLTERGQKNQKVFRVPSNQKINEAIKEAVKQAKIEKPVSFHCARHTFATLLLEASGNIAVVSKLLGHSDIATTQIYAKVLESEKRKAVDLMNSF